MASKKRRRTVCSNSAPASISSSQEPVSYAYVQQMARQQTVDACDVLVREINERVAVLCSKVQSLRYN